MAISAINVEQTPSFRGKWDRTNKGTPYYKTNVGTFLGGVGAGMTLLETIVNVTHGSKEERTISAIAGLIEIPLGIYLGRYIDKKRNAKAQDIADFTRKVGVEKALVACDELEVSKNNRVYYKSKEGKRVCTKFGAVLGGVASLVAMFGNAQGAFKVFAPLLGIGVGAGLGWIKGWFADWLTNISARKHSKDILEGARNI